MDWWDPKKKIFDHPGKPIELYYMSASIFAVLKWIYLHGPESLMWGGMLESQVCAQLTGVPENHWQIYNHECDELISRKSMALAVGAALGLTSWALICVSTGLFVRWTVVNPVCAFVHRTSPPKPP